MPQINEQQLGQVRPSSTTAVSLYSPMQTRTVVIKSIVICNTSGSNATFRIFLDEDGATYDESTAHFWDAEILSKNTVQIDTYYAMDNVEGNLGVRSSSGNGITFTCYGAELQ